MAAARGSAALHGLLQVEAGAELSHVAARVAAVLPVANPGPAIGGGIVTFYRGLRQCLLPHEQASLSGTS